MEFGEMKRNTSNWSNFCMLLRRAGLTASAGLSCSVYKLISRRHIARYIFTFWIKFAIAEMTLTGGGVA